METCLGYLENVAKPIGEEGTIVLTETIDVHDVGTVVWSANGLIELTTDEAPDFHDDAKGNGFELLCWMLLV